MRRLLLRRSSINNFSTSQKTILMDYKQRGQNRQRPSLKMGENISTFKLQSSSKFNDFNIQYLKLKSQSSGIQWHHFDHRSELNTMIFLFPFDKTIPLGVKYSLQKMLQCGSKKYPVRNIIQYMFRRSFSSENLTTTTNDYIFTGYQTSLVKDHKNLMDTYLHMLFNPLFRKEDFQEMIWRYQLRNNGLQVVGELIQQNEYLWQFNENKIHNVIERQLLGRQGLPNIQDIKKIKFEDIVSAHSRIFNLNNLKVFSHGDLHPILLAPKLQKIAQSFPSPSQPNFSLNFERTELQKCPEIQTYTLHQIQNEIPLILSFKIPKDIPEMDRFLLPILSYILFDMPESQFMKWNTPQTPYPKLYGYHDEYFNIGVTLKNKEGGISEKQLLTYEKEIRQSLKNLCTNKIKDQIIEKCILHLQGEYFSNNGLKIIDGCIDRLLNNGKLSQILQVKKNISKTLRDYRKNNLFQKILQKYIVQNDFYIRIWGQRKKNLPQMIVEAKQRILKNEYKNMSSQQLQKILRYQPPTILQDVTLLPQISLNELELFEQKQLPEPSMINGIRVFKNNIQNNVKITIKYDITDIEEQQLKMLPVLCEVFPYLGMKDMKPEAYKKYLQMYIQNIQMKYETTKTLDGMRIFMYLVIQFTQRNAQYGFHVCNGLLNSPYQNNIYSLSQRIRVMGNKTYNQVSEKLIQYHGRYLASLRSPFAFIEDPLQCARSVCHLSETIKKIANPKQSLYGIAHQLTLITNKFSQKQRIQVLFECRQQAHNKYHKYIELILSQLSKEGIKPTPVSIQGFQPEPCMKYFPNYDNQFVFQAFTVPYSTNPNEHPSALVLSSLISQNIQLYNEIGGSFLFKGALVSYLRGGRKKFIQLESYYKKMENIDAAKIAIFKDFKKYTSSDYFYSGVTAEQNRHFKQAVALVKQENVEACLEKYLLNTIKEGKSSMLVLGEHLPNYEPLLKKGWQIERVIDGMSVNMQSQNKKMLPLSTTKYVNIY